MTDTRRMPRMLPLSAGKLKNQEIVAYSFADQARLEEHFRKHGRDCARALFWGRGRKGEYTAHQYVVDANEIIQRWRACHPRSHRTDPCEECKIALGGGRYAFVAIEGNTILTYHLKCSLTSRLVETDSTPDEFLDLAEKAVRKRFGRNRT